MAFEQLSCMELIELVTDYLEGALPAPERSRFEAHLATCTGCTRYLAQMKDTISLTGMLTEDQIAPEVRRDLLAAFRDWKRTRQ
jgi:anti-sigma factor RsiW